MTAQCGNVSYSTSHSARLRPDRCSCRSGRFRAHRVRPEQQTQIGELRPQPKPKSASEKFRYAVIRNESVVKLAPACIAFAEITGGITTFAERNKSSIIKPDHPSGDPARPAAKGQIRKC